VLQVSALRHVTVFVHFNSLLYVRTRGLHVQYLLCVVHVFICGRVHVCTGVRVNLCVCVCVCRGVVGATSVCPYACRDSVAARR
jgi:hypothetical protein